ncbi:MAG: hypothetical protein WC027_02745 [Candidatus Paceibacterota bacterium]
MEAKTTIEAKTTEMVYKASQIDCRSGIKAHEVKGGGCWGPEFIEGRRVVGGGNGTYVTATPARFILWIKIEDEKHEIWTERIFRSLLETKRLTAKIRSRIEATMPKVVAVEEQQGRRGRKYYTLAEDTAIAWALKVLESA